MSRPRGEDGAVPDPARGMEEPLDGSQKRPPEGQGSVSTREADSGDGSVPGRRLARPSCHQEMGASPGSRWTRGGSGGAGRRGSGPRLGGGGSAAKRLPGRAVSPCFAAGPRALAIVLAGLGSPCPRGMRAFFAVWWPAVGALDRFRGR